MSTVSELIRDTMPAPPEASRQSPQTLDQTTEDTTPTPAKRSLNILCIDDDEQILEMMKECLTYLGHQVKVASGGKYGLELFRIAMMKSEPFEIVITDLGMPDMDGYQVARMIKAESASTPIIMMTGQGAIKQHAGASPAGVDVVIGKPPNLQALDTLLLQMAG